MLELPAMNTLYYGDHLDILRRYIKDESVDLVYLDPPFKSNQDYNVLFAERDGTRSVAQIKAFEDIWQWDEAAESRSTNWKPTFEKPTSRHASHSQASLRRPAPRLLGPVRIP